MKHNGKTEAEWYRVYQHCLEMSEKYVAWYVKAADDLDSTLTFLYNEHLRWDARSEEARRAFNALYLGNDSNLSNPSGYLLGGDQERFDLNQCGRM